MKILSKNISGFSILEMVIVLGIMAASATYFMSMQQNIIKAQKRFEIKGEIELMINEVNLVLANRDACRNTMMTSSTAGLIQDNAVIGKVLSSVTTGNREIISNKVRKPGSPYGIVDIKIINASAPQPIDGSTDQIITYNLEISYNILSAILKDFVPAGQPAPEYNTFGRYRVYKIVSKSISARTLSNGLIVHCTSSQSLEAFQGIVETVTETLKKEVCTELGGEIDSNNECVMPPVEMERSEIFETTAGVDLPLTPGADVCFLVSSGLTDTGNRVKTARHSCSIVGPPGRQTLKVWRAASRTRISCKAQCISVCSGKVDARWIARESGVCQPPTPYEANKPGVQYYQLTCSPEKCGGRTCAETPKPAASGPCYNYAIPCPSGQVSCQLGTGVTQCLPSANACMGAGGTPILH